MFGNEVQVGQTVTSMGGYSEMPVGAAGWLLCRVDVSSVWGRDSLPSRPLAVQGCGKGEGIQAEPRGRLVEGMEPTVCGDRVGELIEETVEGEVHRAGARGGQRPLPHPQGADKQNHAKWSRHTTRSPDGRGNAPGGGTLQCSGHGVESERDWPQCEE